MDEPNVVDADDVDDAALPIDADAPERLSLAVVESAHAPTAYIKSYVGVPANTKEKIEKRWVSSRVSRRDAYVEWLEMMRATRDELAPYRTFNSWCDEHDESYRAFYMAESRAGRADITLLYPNQPNGDSDTNAGETMATAVAATVLDAVPPEVLATPTGRKLFIRSMLRAQHLTQVVLDAERKKGVPQSVLADAIDAFGIEDNRDLSEIINEKYSAYEREQAREHAKENVGERADSMTGPIDEWRDTIQFGDALAVLKRLPSDSVQCVVTSPPYYKKRAYGGADVVGEIGQEATLAEYVAHLVEVFREVRRVLTETGTLWLNLGDTYAGAGGGFAGMQYPSNAHSISAASAGIRSQGSRSTLEPGTKPKDLLGVPWAVAFALRDDGWYLRADIIWAKTTCVPESVRDRPTQSHEYAFLLAKSDRYDYDLDAGSEPAVTAGKRAVSASKRSAAGIGVKPSGNARLESYITKETRNMRDVWVVTPRGEGGIHLAQMPRDLAAQCIRIGSKPGDIVLDPFVGVGTVALVAQSLDRHWIGIDLVAEYVVKARERLAANQPDAQLDELEADAEVAGDA